MRSSTVALLCAFLAASCSAKPENVVPAQTPSQILVEDFHLKAAARARETYGADRLNRIAEIVRRDPRRDAAAPQYTALANDPLEFDAIHYRVELEFPPESLQSPQYKGAVELSFKPIQDGYQVLALDSAGLKISEVLLLDSFEKLAFEQRGNQLLVDLGRPYGKADTLTVRVTYDWAANPNIGMYFRSRSGVKEIETIYSNSEPEESKFWFPGNARPNDRATFEAILKVPAPFVAVSNGALLGMNESGGMRTYHWSQQIPMVSYLFVVEAGKWGVDRRTWRNIPVEYYGPSDDMERLSYSLRNTPDMLDYFSDEVIGMRYPYEKYAQVVVPQYMWGGMEHTTATTLTQNTVHSPEAEPQFSSDSLVSHELAHQWFGDLATCKSWDHLWLNEGFATYYEMLYIAKKGGNAALYAELADNADWYFWQESQDNRPLVFPYYVGDLDYYFDGHAYAKGGWVLHMLRRMLGDQAFFTGIRHYIYKQRGTLVETADFRKAMEESSGRDLGWFFDQWAFRPGFPVFESSWTYDETSRKVSLTVTQTQSLVAPGGVAGVMPLFRGPIQVELDGQVRTVELKGPLAGSTGGVEKFTIESPKKPRYVKFNSSGDWLAKVRTKQSLDQWMAQLSSSLDPVAQVEAAGAIAETSKETSEEERAVRTQAILACSKSTGRSTWVRENCLLGLRALAAEKSLPEASRTEVTDTLRGLSTDSDWKVRAAAVSNYGLLSAEKALPALREVLKSDPAQGVVVAALSVIGELKAPESFDLLSAQLGRDSHRDLIRQSALTAMRQLEDSRSLVIGEEYAQSRHGEGARSGAFSLLASVGSRLGGEVSERARLAIEPALNPAEPSYNVRRSAIQALRDLKNTAAIPALRRVAESDPDTRLRALAAEVIQTLGEAPKP